MGKWHGEARTWTTFSTVGGPIIYFGHPFVHHGSIDTFLCRSLLMDYGPWKIKDFFLRTKLSSFPNTSSLFCCFWEWEWDCPAFEIYAWTLVVHVWSSCIKIKLLPGVVNNLYINTVTGQFLSTDKELPVKTIPDFGGLGESWEKVEWSQIDNKIWSESLRGRAGWEEM